MTPLAALRQYLVPLTTVDPEANDAELRAFSAMVGAARMVALGEATHGTREFHLLRHRLIRWLVQHDGFRLIGIEAGWPECLALNRYVVDGEGDPAMALAGTGYWMWDILEFRSIVDWLRSSNSALPYDQRVHLFGFDAVSPSIAVDLIWNVLEVLDPGFAHESLPLREQLGLMSPWQAPDVDDDAPGFAAHLDEISAHLAEARNRMQSGPEHHQCGDALRAVTILQQIDIRRRAIDAPTGWSARDRAMAENAIWQLDQFPSGTGAVLLAHNGHVTRDSRGIFDSSVVPMGGHLAEVLGDAYLSMGLFFGEGSFQAIVDAEIGTPRLDEVVVGLPPAGSLDAALMDATIGPALLLDTRALPDDLGAWLRGPLVSREAGAGFDGEPEMHSTIHPSARHDVLAFVRATTRSNPTPTGVRPRPVVKPDERG